MQHANQELECQTAASPAFAVLTNSALLPYITQFQRGIPLLIHELTSCYDASESTIVMPGMGELVVNVVDAISSAGPVGRFWASAMRCGDLAAVQLVCRMREWPELRGRKDMAIKNLPLYAAICGRLDVVLWLHTNDQIGLSTMPWNGTTLAETITWGHHEVARWLLVNRPDACREDISTATEVAAEQGNLVLLQELIAFCPNALTVQVMDAIA